MQLTQCLMSMRLLIVILFTTSVISCKKDGQTGSVTPKPNIYLTGYGSYGNNLVGAVYWKNGVLIPLNGGQNATGIAFSRSDIYIAGNAGYAYPQGGYGNEAVFWKNGIMQKLGNPPSYANAIAVSGTDIYIAGMAMVNNQYEAVYWKNGVIYPLGDAYSTANAITISGQDVYIAGTTGNNGTIATYWKNGIPVLLETSVESKANALLVSGNDVYVAGNYRNTVTTTDAVYWKNGIRTSLYPGNSDTLVTSTSATGIALSGNDVHITGYINSIDCVYWKNGSMTRLNNPAAYMNTSSNVNAIVVSDQNVYISFNSADYWINGNTLHVGDGYATSIAVQ
ncbi:MAG: hypothetical protein ACJ748_09885 [Flavisolibacter sp.]